MHLISTAMQVRRLRFTMSNSKLDTKNRARTARAQGIQKQKKNKVEDDKIDKQQHES
jgi:hypothetical protein